MGRYNVNRMAEGQKPIKDGLNTLLNIVNRYYGLEEVEADILVHNWYRGMNQILDRRREIMNKDFTREYRKAHQND